MKYPRAGLETSVRMDQLPVGADPASDVATGNEKDPLFDPELPLTPTLAAAALYPSIHPALYSLVASTIMLAKAPGESPPLA